MICAAACVAVFALTSVALFVGHKESCSTGYIHRQLEGLSVQQYTNGEGRFALGSGYLAISTEDKCRYYYKEENGDIKADTADMSNVIIKYTDEQPYVDIKIDKTSYYLDWFVFRLPEIGSTYKYTYTFYVPEGSVINTYTFN